MNFSLANVLPTEIQEKNRSGIIKLMEVFQTDPFRPLVLLFEHHGLLTERSHLLLTDFSFVSKDKNWALKFSILNFLVPILLDEFRIREELRCGEEYWDLERKLCCLLLTKNKVDEPSVPLLVKLMDKFPTLFKSFCVVHICFLEVSLCAFL